MKNINPKEGDWAHIICFIFSINYQIYDYGKMLFKKIGNYNNHIENFIKNYSFYFKNVNNSAKEIEFISPLDFYRKKTKKEDSIINCDICTSSIGELFPCLCCIEERKLINDKIPHFHVLCAYLDGKKMEVIENEENISYENYYNFFLKRENLDKYLIKKTRIYAKIYCSYHSFENERNFEVQKTLRNLVYHKETFLYKDFQNKFQPIKKDKNNSFKLKKTSENENNESNLNLERNNSTKKSLNNYALKQTDNSTEGKYSIFLEF